MGQTSVDGYSIWGWREWKGIERLHERFLRWTLDVDWRTSGYVLREELQRWKTRLRAGKLAWEYERCWEQVIRNEASRGERNKWEEEREKLFTERGLEMERLEGKKRSGEMGYEEFEEKDKQIQEEKRWEKIMESRYKKWYKVIKEPGTPSYLEKGWKEKR